MLVPVVPTYRPGGAGACTCTQSCFVAVRAQLASRVLEPRAWHRYCTSLTLGFRLGQALVFRLRNYTNLDLRMNFIVTRLRVNLGEKGSSSHLL